MSVSALHDRQPSANVELPGSEPLGWLVDLDQPSGAVAELARLLEPQELDRAARFHRDVHRDRFIVGRARTRQLLGPLVGLAPARLRFTAVGAGKPELPELSAMGVSFNVSNSAGVGIVALAGAPRIGVDVEVATGGFSGMDVATHFFASGEVARLRALHDSERELAFLRCWTRKEAFLKAHGTGLSVPLKDFEMSLEPGAPPRLTRCARELQSRLGWDVIDLSLEGVGAVGALVVERAVRVLASPVPLILRNIESCLT